jgi:hypothetical protein
MKTKNYHYVYKITNHNPVDSRKFYIGVRTTKGRLPEDDINYMGSSDTLTAAIKTQGKKYFSKEILSVWQSKDDAYAEEIRLHELYDVCRNMEYYNNANQTSTKFCTDGRVVVFDKNTGKTKSVTKEEFQTVTDYVGVKTGMVSVMDTTDGVFKSVSKEEFEKSEHYIHPATGKVTVIDTTDGLVKHVNCTEYRSCENYVSIATGTVTCYDIRDGKNKQVSKDEFDNADNLISCNAGKVTVLDTRDGIKKSVTKVEFDITSHYVGVKSGRVTAFDIRDKKFKTVTIEEFANDDNYVKGNSKKVVIFDNNDNVVFVSYGNFETFCKKHKLPCFVFRMSYRNNGSPIYQNLRGVTKAKIFKNGNYKYIGWYAKISDDTT